MSSRALQLYGELRRAAARELLNLGLGIDDSSIDFYLVNYLDQQKRLLLRDVKKRREAARSRMGDEP